jgi:phosphoglucosamine mutase
MGELFGTDGIRGTVGKWPLTTEFFLKLGKASAITLRNDKSLSRIIIGRDTRQSGVMLQSALVSGLLEGGMNVIDAGVIPTSGIAWLIKIVGADAGAVISASHNPVEQNGIKFFDSAAQKMPARIEDAIERLAQNEQEMAQWLPPGDIMGYLSNGELFHQLYKDGLIVEHPTHFLNGIKILVDCANGSASSFAAEVFSRAGAKVIAINASPTGNNINVEAGSEYARRAPEMMGRLIQHFQTDFALAFDGDADRVVFIDEEGGLIDGDHILGFLSKYLSQNGKLAANSVVTTNMRNSGLKTYIESMGMTLYEAPVGDKYVVEKINELRRDLGTTGQIGLGGEQAGHIDLITDEFTTGDGIRTALYVMRAFVEAGAASMAEFARGVGKTPQIIASAFVGHGPRLDKEKLKIIESGLLNTIPGLCRANLRYSGTEPLLRVMLESEGNQTEQDLASLAYELCKKVQSFAGISEGEIDILNCTRGGVITPAVKQFSIDI